MEYMISKNVNKRVTVIYTLGWSELLITLISLIIFGGMFLLTGLFIESPIRVLPCLLIPVMTLMVITPNKYNGLSLLSQLKDIKSYIGRQKRYLYEYLSGAEYYENS